MASRESEREELSEGLGSEYPSGKSIEYAVLNFQTALLIVKKISQISSYDIQALLLRAERLRRSRLRFEV